MARWRLIELNKNYNTLKQSYLFYDIAKKIAHFKKHSTLSVISLGIGDVCGPIPKSIVKIMKKALVRECKQKTFKGYPPEVGYDFLRERIAQYYGSLGAQISLDEVFVSCGACPDIAGMLDIFKHNTALIQNPSYPAYVDTNILCGNNILFVDAKKPHVYNELKIEPYLVYLCSPNNPTGLTLSARELEGWVEFALRSKSIILFDSAYMCFIQDDSPKSIFQIKDAKKCAIEISSFSKMAGFTGLRAGWTIVPKELEVDGVLINQMWLRHQTTNFNGIPYHIQKGAEFALSDVGLEQNAKIINNYKQNAKLISNFLSSKHVDFVGGVNSPYIWAKCPNNMTSWQTFDHILNNAGVVVIPGVGFGTLGEGHIRLSAFATTKSTKTAIARLNNLDIWQ